MTIDAAPEPVVICGGGPVGLLLAVLLDRAGIGSVLIERRVDPPSMSMAIGITPPSLCILRRLGLAEPFVAHGVRVCRAVVHEDREQIGELSFASLPGDFRFILSLPQRTGMDILARSLARARQVAFLQGHELVGVEPAGDAVHCRVRGPAGEYALRAGYVVGCDGHRSSVRDWAGLSATPRWYGSRFMMADFPDHTGFGAAAHLYFGRRGSVESFPLPGGLRRWVVSAAAEEWGREPAEVIPAHVRRDAGIELEPVPEGPTSRFRPQRLLAPAYHRGRFILCGDAAHVMCPIGGQGMNTGFADAELLAHILERILRRRDPAEPLLKEYTRIRTASFRAASARAAGGMWLGTRRGRTASWIRRTLIARVLLHRAVRPVLPAYFAMWNLPFATLDTARQRL